MWGWSGCRKLPVGFSTVMGLCLPELEFDLSEIQ
jgi:hypothetical protein